jgi:hypothetical protein
VDAAQIAAELQRAERVLAELQGERTAEIAKAEAEGQRADKIAQMRAVDGVIRRENAAFLRSLREQLEAARRDDQVTAGKG